jgi:hypothetical protein
VNGRIAGYAHAPEDELMDSHACFCGGGAAHRLRLASASPCRCTPDRLRLDDRTLEPIVEHPVGSVHRLRVGSIAHRLPGEA